jgi:hypothetical protein
MISTLISVLGAFGIIFYAPENSKRTKNEQCRLKYSRGIPFEYYAGEYLSVEESEHRIRQVIIIGMSGILATLPWLSPRLDSPNQEKLGFSSDKPVIEQNQKNLTIFEDSILIENSNSTKIDQAIEGSRSPSVQNLLKISGGKENGVIPGAHGFKTSPPISRPYRQNIGTPGSNKPPRAPSGFYRMPPKITNGGFYGNPGGNGGNGNGNSGGGDFNQGIELYKGNSKLEQCPEYYPYTSKSKKKNRKR